MLCFLLYLYSGQHVFVKGREKIGRFQLIYLSLSAREVDIAWYFYGIIFQDAVEKFIDNLRSTSKPQVFQLIVFPFST